MFALVFSVFETFFKWEHVAFNANLFHYLANDINVSVCMTLHNDFMG